MSRAYSSAMRRERSAATRRAVIDAAAAVFSERGWAGTTMARIAQQAGVAVETVYRAVPGGKAGLLSAALHASVAGDAEAAETRLEERTGIRRAIETLGPAAAIGRYAAIQPSTWRRVGPLLTAAESAGADEPLRAILDELEATRLAGMTRFATDLDQAGALKREMPIGIAADILWTVCSHENFDSLVVARGWPDDAYVAWLTRTLVADLVRPSTGADVGVRARRRHRRGSAYQSVAFGLSLYGGMRRKPRRA